MRLVNDFVAAGYGLLTLDIDTECITLQVREGGGEKRKTRVVVKPRGETYVYTYLRLVTYAASSARLLGWCEMRVFFLYFIMSRFWSC